MTLYQMRRANQHFLFGRRIMSAFSENCLPIRSWQSTNYLIVILLISFHYNEIFSIKNKSTFIPTRKKCRVFNVEYKWTAPDSVLPFHSFYQQKSGPFLNFPVLVVPKQLLVHFTLFHGKCSVLWSSNGTLSRTRGEIRLILYESCLHDLILVIVEQILKTRAFYLFLTNVQHVDTEKHAAAFISLACICHKTTFIS